MEALFNKIYAICLGYVQAIQVRYQAGIQSLCLLSTLLFKSLPYLQTWWMCDYEAQLTPPETYLLNCSVKYSKDVVTELTLFLLTGETLPAGSNLSEGARVDICCMHDGSLVLRKTFYL